MGVEELREIAAMLENLSGDAKEIIRTWLAFQYVKLAATFVGVLTPVLFMLWLVRKAIENEITSGRLAEAAGFRGWSSGNLRIALDLLRANREKFTQRH